MNVYTLPIDIDIISNIDESNSCIDMSSFNFKCDESKQIRSSLIFIRNTGLLIPTDFSKCSYEMKETFLLLYMFGDINVDIPVIKSTWIEILMNDGHLKLDSILTLDEIKLFNDKNKEKIMEVKQLIVSLPIVSMKIYEWTMKMDMNIDSAFETTDYCEININNFCNMLNYHNEIMIIISSNNDIKPMIYSKYFYLEDNIYADAMISCLPYLDLLNIMLIEGEEYQEKLINEMIVKEAQ